MESWFSFLWLTVKTKDSTVRRPTLAETKSLVLLLSKRCSFQYSGRFSINFYKRNLVITIVSHTMNWTTWACRGDHYMWLTDCLYKLCLLHLITCQVSFSTKTEFLRYIILFVSRKLLIFNATREWSGYLSLNYQFNFPLTGTNVQAQVKINIRKEKYRNTYTFKDKVAWWNIDTCT